MAHKLIRFVAIAAVFISFAVPARAEMVGEDQTITSGENDTFADIGRHYLKGFVELRAANPDLNPWVMDAGKEIILPGTIILPKTARHEGIVINIAEMRLYDFTDPKQPHIYTIGVGREGLVTPVGTYQIAAKVVGPVWHPTPRMRDEDPTLPAAVPQGNDNPLGKYALYIKDTEYRIHGTDKPWSLGRRASSGCIRLYDANIDALFHHASVKESVQIISEPIKVDVKDGAVYLEAHPDEEMADDYENDYAMDFKVPDGTIKLINTAAGQLKDKLDWGKIRDVLLLRPGYAVKISS